MSIELPPGISFDEEKKRLVPYIKLIKLDTDKFLNLEDNQTEVFNFLNNLKRFQLYQRLCILEKID